jgi:hypothetical protein
LKTVFGFETQPLLRDLNNGHTVIGNDIKLECEVTSNNDEVLIKWDVPLKFNLTVSNCDSFLIVITLEIIFSS